MDFTITPETEELRLRTRAFNNEHVIPLESDPQALHRDCTSLYGATRFKERASTKVNTFHSIP